MSQAPRTNPFRFGGIVEGSNFTDRSREKAELDRALNGANHVILISPRRYGKTSLALSVAKTSGRPLIYLNLQSVTSVIDFANLLLQKILKIYRFENIRRQLAGLRGRPVIETDIQTGAISVYFRPNESDNATSLEEVLNMIERLATPKKKPVVIFDEFQEAEAIDKQLYKKLRSTMQMQYNINYIFIGSEESMMETIFNSQKSPFYHFGLIMRISKIPRAEFESFVDAGLSQVCKQSALAARDIVDFTQSHPYYTQLLAYKCFEFLRDRDYSVDTIPLICGGIVAEQDNNYEKIWGQINKYQQSVLVALSETSDRPQLNKNSTYYSALKVLSKKGLVVKLENYDLEDPFFKFWINLRRG